MPGKPKRRVTNAWRAPVETVDATDDDLDDAIAGLKRQLAQLDEAQPLCNPLWVGARRSCLMAELGRLEKRRG